MTDADVAYARSVLEVVHELASSVHQAGGDCQLALAAVEEVRPRFLLVMSESLSVFDTSEEQLWLQQEFGEENDADFALLSAAPCYRDPAVREALSFFAHRSELEAQGYRPVEDQPAILVK
ncbi:MAG: hypothetical protein R3B48_26405 [Kofleriaceae bacterium]